MISFVVSLIFLIHFRCDVLHGPEFDLTDAQIDGSSVRLGSDIMIISGRLSDSLGEKYVIVSRIPLYGICLTICSSYYEMLSLAE